MHMLALITLHTQETKDSQKMTLRKIGVYCWIYELIVNIIRTQYFLLHLKNKSVLSRWKFDTNSVSMLTSEAFP